MNVLFGKPMKEEQTEPGEGTPLLASSNTMETENPPTSAAAAAAASVNSPQIRPAGGLLFRRSTKQQASSTKTANLRTQRLGEDSRSSLRGSVAFPFFPSLGSTSSSSSNMHFKQLVEPIEALSPLVAGGAIVSKTDGLLRAPARPPSNVKSIPAYAPYHRRARHRSFYLWWINEFRHWWKSSRLLVRLGGLEVMTIAIWSDMVLIEPRGRKNGKRFYKFMKHLGQGGVMKSFLNHVHLFTRSVRLLVAIWRWIESSKVRRLEVGVEEALAFMGNRVSRMLARLVVDSFVQLMLWPFVKIIFKKHRLSWDYWYPAVAIIILGIIRACAPYAASFQGSRAGRVLTRGFFRNLKHRWSPVQRIRQLNLDSDDCCERDEIDENADLAKLAKKIAKALGVSQHIGVDGMDQQNDALRKEGFRQVGAGSGGYAVYECHRRVSKKAGKESEKLTLLLHVTPYGPSLLNVMPRYVVLEREDSQDRRAAWSNFIDSWHWQGPSVVEGYCYQGAFFSPYHFAAMKRRYDEQLLTYGRACQNLSKDPTGRKAGPPVDQPSLKQFLASGKLGRKRKQNEREFRQMQAKVTKVANRLKAMMSPNYCTAPKGVILYFEGLDCSGKSSTGGLVQQALEQAGFDVEMVQYNRPPTAEQQRRPWMDRFKVPDTSEESNETFLEEGTGGSHVPKQNCMGHRHKAIVWDRGPAGDFVYGNLAFATAEEKAARYREFLKFDDECRKKNILFFKLMFVTNRDSIAATLGKRLAQRSMVQDLRTWLKASRGDTMSTPLTLEGLDMIDLHIDPTDFIAFNLYLKNLHRFVNFAVNTDTEKNPWVVVNTTDRYSARKQLLEVFQYQLDTFSPRSGPCAPLCPGFCGPREHPEQETPAFEIAEMLEKQFGKRMRMTTFVFLICILAVIFYYCEHTKWTLFGLLSDD